MSGEAGRLLKQTEQDTREADIVSNRARELFVDPLRGTFDLKHLKAIHAYLFQDLPHHKPGIVRSNTRNWVKHRVLEGQSSVYNVPYAHSDIEGLFERYSRIIRRPQYA